MKMSFHPFSSGTLIVDRGTLNNRDWGIRYEHPNPMFAIRHPKGVVVYDAGMNGQGAADPGGWWGESVASITVKLTEEDCLPAQLRRAGIEPEEVEYAIMSHLHMDHAGELHSLPNALCIVRAAELPYAWWPGRNQWNTYSFRDLLGVRDMNYLEVPDAVDFDLFGDGSLVAVHTPGHTPGHQSLLVTLPDYDRPIFLCQDACYGAENLEGASYGAGLLWNVQQHYRTIETIRFHQKLGREIWFGHEMESWVENVRKFS